MAGVCCKKEWIVEFILSNGVNSSLPKIIKVLKHLRGPTEDGSVEWQISDGKVFVKAVFTQQSTAKFYEDQDESSLPEWDGAVLLLKQYQLNFEPHPQQKQSEFCIVVEEFVLWSAHHAFNRKNTIQNCMQNPKVQSCATAAWNAWSKEKGRNDSMPDMSMNSVPLSQLLAEMENQSDDQETSVFHEEDNQPSTSKPSTVQIVNLKERSFSVMDFIICDKEMDFLNSIEEWKEDYKPPPSSGSTGSSQQRSTGCSQQRSTGSSQQTPTELFLGPTLVDVPKRGRHSSLPRLPVKVVITADVHRNYENSDVESSGDLVSGKTVGNVEQCGDDERGVTNESSSEKQETLPVAPHNTDTQQSYPWTETDEESIHFTCSEPDLSQHLQSSSFPPVSTDASFLNMTIRKPNTKLKPPSTAETASVEVILDSSSTKTDGSWKILTKQKASQSSQESTRSLESETKGKTSSPPESESITNMSSWEPKAKQKGSASLEDIQYSSPTKTDASRSKPTKQTILQSSSESITDVTSSPTKTVSPVIVSSTYDIVDLTFNSPPENMSDSTDGRSKIVKAPSFPCVVSTMNEVGSEETICCILSTDQEDNSEVVKIPNFSSVTSAEQDVSSEVNGYYTQPFVPQCTQSFEPHLNCIEIESSPSCDPGQKHLQTIPSENTSPEICSLSALARENEDSPSIFVSTQRVKHVRPNFKISPIKFQTENEISGFLGDDSEISFQLSPSKFPKTVSSGNKVSVANNKSRCLGDNSEISSNDVSIVTESIAEAANEEIRRLKRLAAPSKEKTSVSHKKQAESDRSGIEMNIRSCGTSETNQKQRQTRRSSGSCKKQAESNRSRIETSVSSCKTSGSNKKQRQTDGSSGSCKKQAESNRSGIETSVSSCKTSGSNQNQTQTERSSVSCKKQAESNRSGIQTDVTSCKEMESDNNNNKHSPQQTKKPYKILRRKGDSLCVHPTGGNLMGQAESWMSERLKSSTSDPECQRAPEISKHISKLCLDKTTIDRIRTVFGKRKVQEFANLAVNSLHNNVNNTSETKSHRDNVSNKHSSSSTKTSEEPGAKKIAKDCDMVCASTSYQTNEANIAKKTAKDYSLPSARKSHQSRAQDPKMIGNDCDTPCSRSRKTRAQDPKTIEKDCDTPCSRSRKTRAQDPKTIVNDCDTPCSRNRKTRAQDPKIIGNDCDTPHASRSHQAEDSSCVAGITTNRQTRGFHLDDIILNRNSPIQSCFVLPNSKQKQTMLCPTLSVKPVVSHTRRLEILSERREKKRSEETAKRRRRCHSDDKPSSGSRTSA